MMRFNRKALALSAACVLALTTEARAQNVSGNQLYDVCSADLSEARGLCAGYHMGLVDGLSYGAFTVFASASSEGVSVQEVNTLVEVTLGYCIPPSATNEQIQDVNLRYLEDNPALRHESARYLFTQAMAEAFPCS